MALTTVEGTVERVNANGIGFRLKESWQKRDGGGTAARYWSVFMPDRIPVTVVVGDRVHVSGALRTEVSKRDPRFVDHTVSNASVQITEQNGDRTFEPAPADEPPFDPTYEPTWNTVPIPEETPF